jgi:hypothetical protein
MGRGCSRLSDLIPETNEKEETSNDLINKKKCYRKAAVTRRKANQVFYKYKYRSDIFRTQTTHRVAWGDAVLLLQLEDGKLELFCVRNVEKINLFLHKYSTLKGTVAREFRPLFFFHQSTLPRALIHGLKPFRIWPRIRRAVLPGPEVASPPI